MNVNNWKIFDFFKQLKLEEVHKLVVEPRCDESCNYTKFCFITKNEANIKFYYAKNKKIEDVYVIKENKCISLYSRKLHEEWIEYIWEQFVDHFNLRIRLMFINEKMTWRWDTEFNY